jgi:hypothetical protein
MEVIVMNNYNFKNTTVAAALLIGSFALAGTANATLTVNPVNGGAPTGVTLDNLDILPSGPLNGPADPTGGTTATGVKVTFVTDGGGVTGGASGINAAPFLSGGNGTGFGSPDQPNGVDTTVYVTAGGTANSLAQFLLPHDEMYFGLLWGSVDSYNTLQFYDSANNLVGTLTGLDVTAAANGDQGANGTFYVNITSDVAFNRVVATSSQHAFEIDNIAYNPVIPSPEPITLSLFGAGLAGLGLLRRRKAA